MLEGGDGSLDRPDRNAAPTGLQRQRSQDLLRISAATAGVLVLLGACLYRRLLHPEWTGGQALQGLWPFYLGGALSICAGWLLGDAKSARGDGA